VDDVNIVNTPRQYAIGLKDTIQGVWEWQGLLAGEPRAAEFQVRHIHKHGMTNWSPSALGPYST